MGTKKNVTKKVRHNPVKSTAAAPFEVAKPISVRGLRKDWRRVKAMVARGANVVITDNGVPIMQLVPVEKPVAAKIDWIAHLEKIRQIAGGKTTGGNAVLEERASYK